MRKPIYNIKIGQVGITVIRVVFQKHLSGVFVSSEIQPENTCMHTQPFFFFIIIGVQLINRVVFQVYSKMIQLGMYIHMCLFFFKFFSYLGYYRILKQSPLCHRVGSYGLYQCIHVNPKLLIYPSLQPSLPITISLFCKSVSLFLFCK